MITFLSLICWGFFSFLMGYNVTPNNIGLNILWIFLGFFVFLVSGLIQILLYTIIARFTKPGNKLKTYLALSSIFFLHTFFVHVLIKVHGKENIPSGKKLTIYANHKTAFDPLLIMQACKFPLAFTPKKSLYKYPILKTWMNSFGSVPIDRDNSRETLKSLAKGIKLVKEGGALIIFPEGGIKDRTKDEMSELKDGAFQITLKSEADILPVSMKNLVKFRRSYFKLFTVIHIYIHPIIKFEQIKTMPSKDIGALLSKIINEGISKN